jgi:hypothetical protein
VNPIKMFDFSQKNNLIPLFLNATYTKKKSSLPLLEEIEKSRKHTIITKYEFHTTGVIRIETIGIGKNSD